MNPSPSGCPDPARLRMVLDDGLPEAEWRELAAHLETCENCRAQLDRWTEDPAVLAGARISDASSPAPSRFLDEMLQRLKRQPEPALYLAAASRAAPPQESGGETQACPPSQSEEPTVLEGDIAPLDFLAPSDRPG